MSLLGTHLSVLAGPTVPLPLPPDVTQRVRSVTVTESDRGRSAFTITLDAGRSGPAAAADTPALTTSPLRPNARVVVLLTRGVLPQTLVDGIVTETTFQPGGTDQRAEISVTGQDVSLLLDRNELAAEHIGLEDSLQVLRIAGPYATQRIVPLVLPPPVMNPPLPMERTPTQQGTDWQHLQQLARWHGYVCYVVPGPFPGPTTLYWGPAVRVGVPQPALSVDLGSATNVRGAVSFRTDVLAPELVAGEVQDPRAGTTIPVRTVAPTRPPLAAFPVSAEHRAQLRTRLLRDPGAGATSALGRAQGVTDATADAVTATGTLSGGEYGSVLRPRALVGMRGAGLVNDGLWYVKQVVHRVARGSYTADFTLTRDGYGALSPVVRV
ncbi:hypothetical protein [Myceligenerans crystallogenes]|uniref:Phage protein D n=1 Tax=Myceligenerans crystallogenes TaxID=316335 RepID=A0ABN2N850_9MICO